MKIDNIFWLRIEGNHIDSASESLQVGIGASNFAEAILDYKKAWMDAVKAL